MTKPKKKLTKTAQANAPLEVDPVFCYAAATELRDTGEWYPWVNSIGSSTKEVEQRWLQMYRSPMEAGRNFKIMRFRLVAAY